MDNFTFYAPTYFAFGEGQEAETGRLIRRFGGSRVLLHYGGGSIKTNGVYHAVTEALKSEGLYYTELGGVRPNPRSGLVKQGIELCRREGIDFILAVGGGSVIDSAKAIAMGVAYGGDFWDIFAGKAPVPENTLPIGTVLTIPAAGSEGSPNAVITREEDNQKWGSPKNDILRPKFSVLNPRFTCSLPRYQTACGITDMMVHILERYLSPTTEAQVTDRLCEALLKTVIEAAPRVIKDPNDYDARANIMWSGTLAHNNLCGVGRVQDWASHQIEHELSALFDVTHGAGLAVVTPAWMEHILYRGVGTKVFARFAVRVWGIEADFEDPERLARKGVERFREFLRSIGMPLTLGELGIDKSAIPELVANRSRGKGFPFGGFASIDEKDMEDILLLSV